MANLPGARLLWFLVALTSCSSQSTGTNRPYERPPTDEELLHSINSASKAAPVIVDAAADPELENLVNDMHGSSRLPTPDPVPSSPEPEPSLSPIRVQASSLSAAYGSNEVSADAKFKDRDVIVSGIVDRVEKEDTYLIHVVLRGHNAASEITCTWIGADDDLLRLKRGQLISLQGVCRGKKGTRSVQVAACRVP